MPAIRLKPGRDRSLRNRHPWVFSGAIQRPQERIPPGSVIDIRSHAGEFLARGYYNPRSQIAIRALTWDEAEAIDADFWRRRLQAALLRRQSLLDGEETTACRVVFAESDGLPGLIVDRYDEWLVLQSLTLGIEGWKSLLAELLMELLAPRGIYERSDVDVRRHEGLAPATGCLCGESPPERLEIRENGLRFWVDLLQGHKTGFYLDQRDNRRQVAPYCVSADVLNVFAYTGPFAVYAAAAGAKSVTNLDSSPDALAWAQSNLALNGYESLPATQLQGDAFQVLRRLLDEGRRYDVVILDPPKFAFSRAQVLAATRGYKDINMLAMRLLHPGGWLCTFSCSGLVSADLFQKVLFGASVDVNREVRIVAWLGQSDDHPVLLTFPEAAYLKGFICRVE